MSQELPRILGPQFPLEIGALLVAVPFLVTVTPFVTFAPLNAETAPRFLVNPTLVSGRMVASETSIAEIWHWTPLKRVTDVNFTMT